jgi:uncharacterized protein (DUF983 family)
MITEKVSGFCDNCKEMEVVYDFITEKYKCKKCKKESKKDFTTMFRE